MDNLFNKELCAERHDRIEEELLRHDDKIDSLEKCTIKLTQMIDRHEEQCDEYETRLKMLENKPLDIFTKIMSYLLSTGCGALAAWLVQRFMG